MSKSKIDPYQLATFFFHINIFNVNTNVLNASLNKIIKLQSIFKY